MFLDNVLFPVCQLIFPQSIAQCRTGMIKSVKRVRILLIRHMPVIEKIIVQKRSPDQLPPAAGNVQSCADGKAASCHTQHMVINRHAAMLNVLFRPLEIS